MNDEGQTPPPAGGPEGQPAEEELRRDEEELRRRIEENLRKVRVQDVLLESVVTIINLTARRIGKPDERDLAQAQTGIEAVRALVELLEPEPQAQVRDALSELQVLYARQAGGEEVSEAEAPAEGAEPAPQEPQEGAPKRPGGEPPPGLWVPPGS
jgi:hypothetical protein